MPQASKTTTSRRKKPRQARAKATVQAILEATAQVLVSDGYSRLTTTKVAERAGVSVGTLYQYFGDKDALVRALKEQHVGEVLGAMAAEGERFAGASLESKVRAALGGLLRTKAAHGGLSTALSAAMIEIDGRVSLEESVGVAEQIVRGLLEAHADEVHVEDLEVTAHTLVHAVDGVVTAIVVGRTRPLEDPRNLDELVRLVMGYLQAG